MKCKYCGSSCIIKKGMRRRKKKTLQQYKCNKCGRYFTDSLMEGSYAKGLRMINKASEVSPVGLLLSNARLCMPVGRNQLRGWFTECWYMGIDTKPDLVKQTKCEQSTSGVQ